MIDLADSQDQEPGRDQLVACSKEQWISGKNDIYSNRQMCESVCKKESACGECILQDAQNMTEVVWQLGRKRFYKTYYTFYTGPNSIHM